MKLNWKITFLSKHLLTGWHALAGFCLTRIERFATASSAGVFALRAHMGFAYRFLIDVTVKPPNCLREE